MGRTGGRRYRANRETVLQGATVCYLCGQLIDHSIAAPDPMSPSAHHLVPYAAGGGDEVPNLRPTHLVCNQQQGDKPTRVINRNSREWT
ncbi:HNH endonuclease [Rhodococcus qingshengii]|uniref:HNH endonuclease n=1 Tax=Rhodococcus qingshengii TaxID=334542 RepID=UPI0037C937E7